jgi:acetylornithine deacetylase/succinyl-diaminopimelate desuccinylase-like protein
MVEFDDGLAVAMRGAVQARREDAVSLLQELVRVPSVTGEEGAVGAVVGRALSDLGFGLRGDVTVAATVGEENGGLGALSTVLRGYRADAAIITEPTRLALVPAQGGSLVFRLKIPRRRTRRGRLGAGEVRPHLREPARAGAGAQRRTQSPTLRRGTQQSAHQHRRRKGR